MRKLILFFCILFISCAGQIESVDQSKAVIRVYHEKLIGGQDDVELIDLGLKAIPRDEEFLLTLIENWFGGCWPGAPCPEKDDIYLSRGDLKPGSIEIRIR